jgi:hypothetical protein
VILRAGSLGGPKLNGHTRVSASRLGVPIASLLLVLDRNIATEPLSTSVHMEGLLSTPRASAAINGFW